MYTPSFYTQPIFFFSTGLRHALLWVAEVETNSGMWDGVPLAPGLIPAWRQMDMDLSTVVPKSDSFQTDLI